MAKKELKYDWFTVRVDEVWKAREVIEKLGQPVKISGFSQEDTARLSEQEHTWICWVLSESEIRELAKQNKIDPNKITEEQLETIAHNFKKSMEWVCDDWGDWLEEAIKNEFEEAKKNG